MGSTANKPPETVPDGRRHGQFPEMWQFGGREPCIQTPTYDTPATAGKQATAGMLATARIPAATGTPA